MVLKDKKSSQKLSFTNQYQITTHQQQQNQKPNQPKGAFNHTITKTANIIIIQHLIASNQLGDNRQKQMSIHQMIVRIKKQQAIQQKQVKKLCQKVQEILVNESNLQPVSAPVNVIGDVHGQFYDVLKLFELGGPLPEQKYIFIGDFVDRGYNSVQTILLLLCYKLLYPDRIYLLRGNHQSRYKGLFLMYTVCRQVSCMYGFHEQVTRKYGNANVWRYCNDLFDYLPLAAIIDDQLFCVHGGLSPDIHALDQVRELNRKQEIPTEGPFADLMWSDPEEIDTWAHGSRGAGWLFGHKVVDEFNRHNGLKLIVRAHQLAQEGYTIWFDKKNLVTVWSAPNYCYRCNNLASIMKVNQHLDYDFQVYGPDQRSKQSTHYSKIIPYFL